MVLLFLAVSLEAYCTPVLGSSHVDFLSLPIFFFWEGPPLLFDIYGLSCFGPVSQEVSLDSPCGLDSADVGTLSVPEREIQECRNFCMETHLQRRHSKWMDCAKSTRHRIWGICRFCCYFDSAFPASSSIRMMKFIQNAIFPRKCRCWYSFPDSNFLLEIKTRCAL